MIFATGITTAPRPGDANYLPQCVQSWRRAGWEPIVFAEPGSDLTGVEAEVVQRQRRYGCWHNWLTMLDQLLVLEPDADAVLTIQDDVLVSPGSRKVVERLMWPSSQVGVVGLYTAGHYSRVYIVRGTNGSRFGNEFGSESEAKRYARRLGHDDYEIVKDSRSGGLHCIETSSMWGACALLFPRAVAEKIVRHPFALNWNGHIAPRGGDSREQWLRRVADWRDKKPEDVKQSDYAIGRLVSMLGLEKWWFHNPSLAQHVGSVSALNNGRALPGSNRMANQWLGEDVDVSKIGPYAC